MNKPSRAAIQEAYAKALGFDRSTGANVRCSQCEALVINGIPVHERGCPNATHECVECEARIPLRHRYCDECAENQGDPVAITDLNKERENDEQS